MMQKKRPDINKILRSILLILGIVLMLLKISARASAADMPDYVKEYLDDYLVDNNFPSSFQTYYNNAVSDGCAYFLAYQLGGGWHYLFMCSHEYTFEPRSTSSAWYPGTTPFNGNFNGSFGSQYLGSTVNPNATSNYSGFAYSFLWQNSGSPIKAYKYSIIPKTGSTTYNGKTVYSIYGSQTSLYSISISVTYNQSYSNIACYGNMWIDTSGSLKAQETTVPDPVDSRFSAWTSLDQSGKKLLNVSWDSQAYPNTGNFVYESSTIALQVAVNGHSSTVSFSSTDYPELFVSGNSSYIPYKFIQKLANIATVQPSDTFYLEKITLTQQAYPSAAGSSASQSYTASTVYSLNLGEDVVEIPNIQQVQTVSVNYTQIVSGADFAVSSGTSVTPPDWANILSIAICDYTSAGGSTTINDPSLYDYIFMKDNGAMALYSSSSSDFNINIFVNGLTASSTEVSVPFQQGLSLFYKDFLPELFNSYDVVLISMNSINGSSATVTDSYYYTASYYSKLSIRSLGNLQLGVEAAAYYSKALYDYCYIRFNGIAESLESMRISNNNLLSSINANILNLQDFVSSGTDRIVNAISSISSGGGGMSVSDLSGALNTLFMPSFEWDEVNYQYYLDSMGVLALPFEFVFDTQSIIKNNYSALLVMPVNDLSVPLGKDFSNNDIEFTVFEDHEDFTFSPTSIFPAALWSVFQYLAAFALVIGEAWFTYVHIFRKEEKSGDF